MWISYKSRDVLISYFKISSHPIDTHIHKYFEFLWFMDGDASYIIDSKTYQLQSGDIILTPPDKLHTISFNNDSAYERAFIQLSPRLLSRIPRQLVKNIIGGVTTDIIKKDIAAAHGLYDYYNDVIELLQDRNAKNEFLTELLVQKFAVAVNEAITDANAQHSENKTVSALKDYLDENITAPLNLDEISRRFFMSKYYLCHLFKEETGITISDYVSLKRIAAVREYLNKDIPITEVYRHCGFNDYSTFYRTVKKYTGKKPSEFYK